eukprot:52145-Amphidinium_carterae.1
MEELNSDPSSQILSRFCHVVISDCSLTTFGKRHQSSHAHQRNSPLLGIAVHRNDAEPFGETRLALIVRVSE